MSNIAVGIQRSAEKLWCCRLDADGRMRHMWYFAYNVLLFLASPLILVVLLAKKRCRRGFLQRLGISIRRGGLRPASDKLLWVHAVSLGEVLASVPLVLEVHRRYPHWKIVVSTVTETGREALERRLTGVAEHRYAPLDFPWTVSRVVAQLNPDVFLFVETELWPNLLRRLARRGTPAVLVNGRLSSRSFGRYALIKPFMKEVLGHVSLCLMQSERDAQRILDLGARPERVVRTGNIKFDQPLPQSAAGLELSRQAIGVREGEDLIVAGSTHPGEEEQLLDCYRNLRAEFPTLVLVLAPRHIERATEVETTVKQFGLTPVRRTDIIRGSTAHSSPGDGRVIVLDTRGELATIYRFASVAFVGGTLVEIGGHNLLEPAAWGRPVFFGPFTDHCAEVAQMLLRAGGGKGVRDSAQLMEELRRLLGDRHALEQMGQAARRVVEDNRGAADRSMAHVAKLLDALDRPHDR